MATKEDIKLRIKELRKLERQAKHLIYRMHKLENDWKKLRQDLPNNIPQTLGDALSKWNKINRD